MELNVNDNDNIVKSPRAEDIGRALDARYFPDGWYIALESEHGATRGHPLPRGERVSASPRACIPLVCAATRSRASSAY